jgi:hypothetical protein
MAFWTWQDNVWEWTSSLWGKKRDEPDFKYPYDPMDGHETGVSVPHRVDSEVSHEKALWQSAP